ncbi:MAG TPA: tetratricopeptide repeat protein [Nitrospiria bacterium]|nr:tetratricopeptide repeat protein [Nitrospiria bacterium]
MISRTNFLFFAIFIPLFFVSPAWPQVQSGSSQGEEHLQKGTTFLFSGNLDEAEKEFLAAISQNASLHRAHYGLALVYLQKNQLEKSEKAFRDTLLLQPQYAPAYRGLGLVFEGKNDLANAVIHYQKTVSLGAINPAFANDVAIARFRLSQIGESPEIALKVRELYQKATAFLKEKKNDEALKEFFLVLDLVPKKLDALENAGVILLDQGKPEESAGLLRRIIAIDPSILFAHYLLGAVEELQGRIGEAWEEFHTVLQMGEKTPGQKDVVKARERIDQLGSTKEIALSADGRLKEAAALYEKADLAGAEKEYREILQAVPENIRAKFGIASIDFKKERTEEAKKLLIEATQKDPRLLRGHLFLGKIYLKEKEVRKAFEEFNQVIDLGKLPVFRDQFKADIDEARREIGQLGGDIVRAQQIQQLLNEGNELFKREDFDHAAEKFNQVLALSPENLSALEKLGSIYIREISFNPEKGEAIFRKMLQINPDLLLPRFYLAFLADKKGDFEKAIALYQELIQVDKKESDITVRAKKLLAEMGGDPEKAKEIRAHLKKGGELANENKLAEAKTEYQKVLEIVPEQSQALYLLALIDLKQNNISDAEKNLRRVVAAEPAHIEGRLQLALLLGGKGAYEEGLKELEKVIEIGKEGKSVQSAKVELEGMKKKAEGEKHFTAGMEILTKLEALEKASPAKPGEPLSPEKKNLLARGIKELEESIRFNQDNPFYLYNLGYAYLKNLDLLSAEFSFQKAIERKPDFLIAHYRLAVLYDLVDALEGAIKEYEKVLELGAPEDEEVKEAKLKIAGMRGKLGIREEAKGYEIIGEALFMEQQDKDRALPLLKKAIEITPGNEDYWYNLGIFYETIPNQEEAVKAYETAIRVRSTFSKPRFYLGLIQEKRGEREAAYENFKKAKEYLVDDKSKEALLIQERVSFYDTTLSGSLTYGVFNYDSNIGDTENGPEVADVSSTFGLNLKYFYYKSLKLLLSSDFSATTVTYYYTQNLVNFESATFDARWPDIHGLSIAAGGALGMNFAYGGMGGWNSQVKADFQEKMGWFDAVITHIDYSYAISVLNPFYDSVREDISWTFIKNQFKSGSLTATLGFSDIEVVAQDYSNDVWTATAVYSRSLADYLNGSITCGLGQASYKYPDSTALQDGLGEFFRKNRFLNLSGTLIYALFKDMTISGTMGYQKVYSNIGALSNPNLADILSKQTSAIGGYSKFTLGFSVNYFF